jgi:hypothetical protein
MTGSQPTMPYSASTLIRHARLVRAETQVPSGDEAGDLRIREGVVGWHQHVHMDQWGKHCGSRTGPLGFMSKSSVATADHACIEARSAAYDARLRWRGRNPMMLVTSANRPASRPRGNRGDR